MLAAILLVSFLYYTNGDNTGKSATTPPVSQNSSLRMIVNKTFQVSPGSDVNYSFDVGTSTVSEISLTAYSNFTPASLQLEAGRYAYNRITLADSKSVSSQYITFSDPPAVVIYSGIWYLLIQNVSIKGSIHVIVGYK